MSQADLNRRLNEAIVLIQSGRRAEGHTILIELSQQFPDIEQIWMWLASATDNTVDRVQYLEHALSLNPKNQKARIALTRLTGELPATPEQEDNIDVLPGTPSFSTRRLESWAIAIVGMAAIILVVLALSLLIPVIFAPKPTPTSTLTPSATFTPSMTFTASITPGGTTLTPVGAIQTLPPSWTPLPTLTPSDTFTPSNTPKPTETFTASPRPTDRPSLTPAPTITPGGPSFTPVSDTPTPSLTPSKTPSYFPSKRPTDTPTDTPTNTKTPQS